MPAQDTALSELIIKYLSNELSPEEQQWLDQWRQASNKNEALFNWFANEAQLETELMQVLSIDKNAARKKALQLEFPAAVRVHRVHFIRTAWFKYAASVILLAGIVALVLVFSTRNKKELATTNEERPSQTDIAPGGNKALLTLADGSTIVLNDATKGTIAQQGNTQVIKLDNGQIAYRLEGLKEEVTMMNTMTTPNGGQYQLVLPDGTKVWLNAASSITYPTAFTGGKRRVSVIGEAYFEVIKNKALPFIVNIHGRSEVEVLGTKFNINSYANESSIKTTLLEGRIAVTLSPDTILGSSGKNNRQAVRSAILTPGQQAMITAGTAGAGEMIVRSGVDVAQALAWKEGIFDFNGADLKAVLRQLERWYDISVQFKGTVSGEVFKGKMYRNVSLSNVLNGLQKMGVNCKLEGKTVIVY